MRIQHERGEGERWVVTVWRTRPGENKSERRFGVPQAERAKVTRELVALVQGVDVASLG